MNPNQYPGRQAYFLPDLWGRDVKANKNNPQHIAMREYIIRVIQKEPLPKLIEDMMNESTTKKASKAA